MARYAAAARSQTIAHMQQSRRIAMLLAFTHVYEGEAQDDAVDRLETIGELDAAALT